MTGAGFGDTLNLIHQESLFELIDALPSSPMARSPAAKKFLIKVADGARVEKP